MIADALSTVVRKDFSITNVCISSNSLFNSDILFTSVNNLIVLLIPPVVNNSPIDSSILIQEKNEEFISEFMYKFLTNRFIKIDNNLYFRDGERLRKIIDDPYEKIKIITKEHRVGHEGIQKTYERIKRKLLLEKFNFRCKTIKKFLLRQ